MDTNSNLKEFWNANIYKKKSNKNLQDYKQIYYKKRDFSVYICIYLFMM